MAIAVLLGALVSPASLIPYSLSRAGQLLPAGPNWLYIWELPTWLRVLRRPLEAVIPAERPE